MAAVGAVSCDFVKGQHAEPKERTEVYQMPGADGYGAHLLGLGDSPFSFDAVKFGTNAAVNSWITSIAALQGTIVTIVDDFGDPLTNMLIQRIGRGVKTPAQEPGTSNDTRGSMRISGVQRTS